MERPLSAKRLQILIVFCGGGGGRLRLRAQLESYVLVCALYHMLFDCQPLFSHFPSFLRIDFSMAFALLPFAMRIQQCSLGTCPVIKREAGFGSGGHDARRRDKAMRGIGAERQRSGMAARTKRRSRLMAGEVPTPAARRE
jgi:hypothetical protein